MPPALESRVQVEESFAVVVNCFNLLFRGEAVPLSDIICYCQIWGVYDIERFIVLFKAAEVTIMKLQQDKLEGKNKSGVESV